MGAWNGRPTTCFSCYRELTRYDLLELAVYEPHEPLGRSRLKDGCGQVASNHVDAKISHCLTTSSLLHALRGLLHPLVNRTNINLEGIRPIKV